MAKDPRRERFKAGFAVLFPRVKDAMIQRCWMIVKDLPDQNRREITEALIRAARWSVAQGARAKVAKR